MSRHRIRLCLENIIGDDTRDKEVEIVIWSSTKNCGRKGVCKVENQ